MEFIGHWLPESPVLIALVALAVSVLLIGRIRSNKRGSESGKYPGPSGWPVMGCLPLLGSVAHRSLAELAKKYGPLMFMKLGSVNVVVASSSKMVQHFLKTHDKIWAYRAPPTAARIVTYLGNGIVWTDYGARWRYLRKVFMLELFTAKRVASFEGVRREEIVNGVNDAINASASGEKPARMDLILKKNAMNVIIRMMMNEGNLSEEATKIRNSEELQDILKETFAVFASFYIGDFIPSLKWFDPQGLKKKMYSLTNKWDKLFHVILDDHKWKHDPRSPAAKQKSVQNIVDVLLTRPRDGDGEYLSEAEIKGVFLDIFFAGTETNSTTVQGGLCELLRHPRVLEKAQAEMDSVVGRNRLVEESDLPNLPYLIAVVKETFRLHNATNMLVPHKSSEDCEIEGYKIPAETMLLVNVYAIHRDPAEYERPLDFYPERFVGSEKDVHGTDFGLIPFGSGRRVCPGKGLGISMVQYTMAVIIQTCNMRLPVHMKPQDLDPEEMKTQTLELIVTPRLSRDLLVHK